MPAITLHWPGRLGLSSILYSRLCRRFEREFGARDSLLALGPFAVARAGTRAPLPSVLAMSLPTSVSRESELVDVPDDSPGSAGFARPRV